MHVSLPHLNLTSGLEFVIIIKGHGQNVTCAHLSTCVGPCTCKAWSSILRITMYYVQLGFEIGVHNGQPDISLN